MNRRDFLFIGAGGTALSLAGANPLAGVAQTRHSDASIKAVAFDAFPLFDPRPILKLSKTLFPHHDGFGKAWFEKIFAYTWLRTTADRYRSFNQIIGDALDYTAAARNADLLSTNRGKLLDAWMMLKPWTDVMEALEQLRAQNIRSASLSNFTEDMLRTNAASAGIENWFDYLSTDLAAAFKPDPRAYQLGIDKLGLPKHQITFCAFAAWDAAGASWFGYPTAWVNRLGQPVERLVNLSSLFQAAPVEVRRPPRLCTTGHSSEQCGGEQGTACIGVPRGKPLYLSFAEQKLTYGFTQFHLFSLLSSADMESSSKALRISASNVSTH